MCDHPKLRTFELVDKVAVFVNRVTAGGFLEKIVLSKYLGFLDD